MFLVTYGGIGVNLPILQKVMCIHPTNKGKENAALFPWDIILQNPFGKLYKCKVWGEIWTIFHQIRQDILFPLQKLYKSYPATEISTLNSVFDFKLIRNDKAQAASLGIPTRDVPGISNKLTLSQKGKAWERGPHKRK